MRRLGSVFHTGTVAVAGALVLLVVGLVYLLAHGALASISSFGVGFLISSSWSVGSGSFGGAPAIVGTLVTSVLAVALGLPVALGVALFASEIAPRRWRRPFGYLVDLSAAVPSVVYGFWAFEVVVPFFRGSVEPSLARSPLGPVLFSGPLLGTDLLTASVVLAIMIVPTVAALSRDALRAVPRAQREAALGLGATRWEASRMTVLGSATPGIIGATALGLGRAIGETIAVTLIIGNICVLPSSLVASSCTIPSWLVTRFTESTGLERSALFELALLLFVVSLAVNIGARWLLRRSEGSRRAGSRRSRVVRLHRSGETGAPGPSAAPAWWERVHRASRSRRRRRRAVEWAVVALALGAVALALYPLASLVDSAVVGGGAAVLRPSFYTSAPPPACGLNQSACPLGGIGPEIEGTLVLLGMAGAIGLPVGLLAGIYLSEYGRHRFGQTVGVLVDSLLGMPTILVGIFVFALFVRLDRPDAQSALAGAGALAVLMIPIVAKATEVALRSVPASVREGALALGFPRHRVTLRVVLGSARGALVTGNLLAIMRATGETAALVLTAGTSTYWLSSLHSPAPALAPFIYDSLIVYLGSPNYVTDAWGAALILLAIIAAVSAAARLAVGPGDEGGAS